VVAGAVAVWVWVTVVDDVGPVTVSVFVVADSVVVTVFVRGGEVVVVLVVAVVVTPGCAPATGFVPAGACERDATG
jgi:hypothetical protein